jgi:hypothetical protein
MSESPGWERLAAFEGGSVSWLTAAPAGDGSWHVFAATTVGVFRSVDGGLTWSPLGGASRVAGVEVVATSPRYAEDGIVLAGGYDGLFRWREGGAGWEHVLANARVLGLAVLAGNGAGDGAALTLLAGTEHDGILTSRDGGRTWTGANPGLLDLTVMALAVSPGFTQDGLAFAATASGLYRTRNGAESWRQIELDWDDVVVQCLALSPDFGEDRVVLAGTEDHGLLRSDDAGRSWEQVPALADRMVNSLSYGRDGRVVAATDAGLALSADAGESWKRVGEDLGGIAGALALRAGDDAVVLAGLPETGAPKVPGLPHTGVARSTDDGQTWTAASSGLAGAPFVGIMLSSSFEQDRTIYAYGLQMYPGISEDGGKTWMMLDDDLEAYVHVEALPDGRLVDAASPEAMWRELVPPAGGEVVAVGVAPEINKQRDAAIYFATVGSGSGSGQSLTLWRTTSRGQRWGRWLEIPDVPGGSAVQVVALPANGWGDTVLLGQGGTVYRPRPGSWQVTGGSRRPVWDVGELPGEADAGRVAALTGLVASPDYARDRTVFAATSAGVSVSRDGGATFAPWSDGLKPASTVAVAPSPAYAGDRLVFALGLGGTIWRRRDA